MSEKALNILDRIYELTYKMQKHIFLAMLTKEEKQTDEHIKKIMECNEKIEELYSNNWH